MKRRDPVEESLNALSDLRHQPASEALAAQLRPFLANKSNLVVAKAARIAGDLRITELTPLLVEAFHRLMDNPSKLDKGCAALTAIAGALYSLDYDAPEVFLQGVRHIQMEPSFGPPVDAAALLRGHSALGLVRTRHPDALFEVVRLLVDKEPGVRMAAARALGSVVAETTELLLSLKVLAGDQEPDVLAECFSGMLASGAARSLAFVASYLDHDDDAIAEAAILALGSSRLPQAIDTLKQKWNRTALGPLRKTLLLAFATARQDCALEFLLSLVSTADPPVAVDVIAALSACRNDERTRQSLDQAVRQRADPRVTAAFQAEFP